MIYRYEWGKLYIQYIYYKITSVCGRLCSDMSAGNEDKNLSTAECRFFDFKDKTIPKPSINRVAFILVYAWI